MTVPVVGVDPGGRSTGVVTRHADRLLYAATVTRDGTLADYLTEVTCTVTKAVACAVTDQAGTTDPIVTPIVAVEDLNEPTPHLGLTNVRGLIGAAEVLGAVLHAYPTAVLVPPGRHGSAPLDTYPPALVGARERQGTGKARHVRSSWDVAGLGLTLHRMATR